jgi:hypothetical protein
VRSLKASNNKNVIKSLPGVVAVRIENRLVALLPPPLNRYYLLADCPDGIASMLLPKLDEFDSLWELTNNICDRYLEPVAA